MNDVLYVDTHNRLVGIGVGRKQCGRLEGKRQMGDVSICETGRKLR